MRNIKKVGIWLLIGIMVFTSLPFSIVHAKGIQTPYSIVGSDEEPENNLLANWSFEETEKSPSESNGPSGTHWNKDLWTDDIKAAGWDFQKWKIDRPTADFNATIDTTNKAHGEQSVKITVLNSNTNTQAFLKQINLEVKGETYYDFNFLAKLENIVGSQLIARIEEYNASGGRTNVDFNFGKGTSDWTQSEHTFKTKASTVKINLIFVMPSSTTGSFWLDNVSLYETDLTLKSIALDETNIVLSKGTSKQLTATLYPDITNETNIQWISDNPNVATVDENGLVNAAGAGKTIIRVKSTIQSNIEATCAVEVMDGDIVVNQVEIQSEDMNLELGQKHFMQYETYPKTAVNPDIEMIWSSSNESVFTIDANGLLKSVNTGTATLKIEAKDNPTITDQITITVVKDTTSQEYSLMKDRWLKRIVGDESLNLDNEAISSYVDSLSANALDLWETMDKSEDRTYLWPLKEGDTTSADYTTHFRNINTLAYAFGTKGSTLEGNPELYADIISALDFMTITKRYNGSYSTGNWWDWQIGSAQPFTDTLMILSDYMPEEQAERYAKCIGGYAYDPSIQWGGYTATGANRTDIGISVLGTAIILEDDAKMELINTKIPPVFKLVTSGDGLYKDGSVVQHTYFAYSGSYGAELMKGIGRILSTIDDTQWEITSLDIENVYETIRNGYIPLMHKGRMMSMMSGRSITRAPGTNKFATEFSGGQETISNIMVIAMFAPEEYKKEFESSAKYWINESKNTYDFYANARDIEALQNADRICSDSSIESVSTFEGVKVYSMDRAIQQTDTYGVGISMYSKRIRNFELQSTGSADSKKYENIKGWHQADGALYIYNDDLETFDEGYWATVDSYRLPGTTIDTKQLGIGEKSSTASPQSWVGGSTDGVQGAVGMYLDKTNTNMNLKAKKSWFLLDGQIVALGSNITGTTTASIETIIENRMLNETGSNKVTLNGQEEDLLKTRSVKNADLEAGSWAHLEGTNPGASIGYYFPEQTSISYNKETTTASYEEVNTLFVNGIDYTKSYYKMLINHGQNVIDDSYEYVILPGKTAEETAAYAENNSLTILENSQDAHAILEASTKTFAMNVWNTVGHSLNGYTVNKACSIISSQEDGILTIAISDPMRQGTKITLSLDEEYLEVVSMDSNVTMAEDEKSFIFDSAYMAGGSAVIKVRVLETETLEDKIAEAEQLVETEYTPSSWNALQAIITEAKDVLTNAKTQDEIDQALESLETAIDNLVKKANKEALEELITKVEALNKEEYTPESWKAVEDVLTTVKGIVKDENASQTTVDEAFKDLKDVVDKLVKTVNKTAVENLIKQIENLKEDNYTKDSWSILMSELAKAKDLLQSNDLTQEEVNEIEIQLKTAFDNLVKTDNDQVATGDYVNTLGYTLPFIGALFLLILINKKRKSNVDKEI